MESMEDSPVMDGSLRDAPKSAMAMSAAPTFAVVGSNVYGATGRRVQCLDLISLRFLWAVAAPCFQITEPMH
jgi:hypothetical protein